MKSIKRYSIFLLGIIILTLGVALIAKSNIGNGSFDSINFGLQAKFGGNLSFWVALVSLIGLIIASIINKKIPNIFSFITAYIVGVFIEIWVKITEPIVINNLVFRYLTFFLAIFTLAIGISIYLLAKLPPNAIDYLVLTISETYNIKLGTVKLLVDFICIIIALIVKGPIGIGTILATVLLGPTINMVQGPIKKVFLGKEKDINYEEKIAS